MTEQRMTQRASRRGATPAARKKAFLAAFRQTGNVKAAAEAAEIDRSLAYVWKRGDPEYAVMFSDAQADAADLLELEARRRAVHGVEKPVIHQGKVVETWVDEEGNIVNTETPGAKLIPLTITQYSDTLLIFLLKGANPDKYRERTESHVRHSGQLAVEHHGELARRLREDPEAREKVDDLLRHLANS
jgi:hypothetical protein